MPPFKVKKPCSFYSTNSCMKGASCPYSHTGQLLSSPRIVCKHYKTGTCKFGERCQNIHAKPNNDVPPEFSGIPCRFWAIGSCTKGDQCSFSHKPLTPEATSWREQHPSPAANFSGTSDRSVEGSSIDNVSVTGHLDY